ncbi:MAG: sugar porter family MFS transporter [Akkermansiaceae bacterium]|nr:sugar porter family MFS transporter [Akkermansiaceae bacterium]
MNTPSPRQPLMSRIFFWSLVSSLAGFLFGFDTVVISGAEKRIQELWQLDDLFHGVATASALYGTVLGALVGGWPTDRYGRKPTLIGIGILYFVSAVWSGLAGDPYAFIVARFIGGLGVGISTIVAPLYIAEISPPERRGRLTGLYQFNIVFGILMALLSNFLLARYLPETVAWRWMLGVEALPAAIYMAACFVLPESPRWLLVRKGDHERGRQVLQLIEPGLPPEKVAAHAEEIIASSHAESLGGREPFWTPRLRLPILLAFFIALFNQFSGVNAILYYAPRVFEMAGLGKSAALLQSVGIGVTNLLFTFLGLWLIDRIGRKTLLYMGGVGYVLSLAGIALGFRYQVSGLVPVCVFSFMASHAIGQGAVVWVYISEIFPNRHRAAGQAVGCITLWVACALISTLFPKAAKVFQPEMVFWFFCGMMIIHLVWVKLMVRETKGVPLEQMLDSFQRGKHPAAGPTADS